jgi:hypothetical protein
MKYEEKFRQAFAENFGDAKFVRPSEARAVFSDLHVPPEVIPLNRNVYSYKELLDVFLHLKKD